MSNRMWKIVDLGGGEFLLMPYDLMDGPFGIITLIVVSLLTIVLFSLIKDVVFLAFLCLILVMGVVTCFAMSNTLWSFVLTAIPIFVYGFEALVYGMFRATVNTDMGMMAIFVWVVLGGALLVAAIGLMTVHIAIGLPCLFYFAFMWFIPFSLAGTGKDPVAFKYLFNVTYLLTFIFFLVWVIAELTGKNNDNRCRWTAQGLRVDILSLGLGIVPVVMACLLSRVYPVIAFVLVIGVYVGCGYLLAIVTNKFKGDSQDLKAAFGPMMLPFVYFGIFYFYKDVNMNLLVPYGFLPSLMSMFNNGITEAFANGIGNVIAGFNSILSGILYLIISLAASLFDKKINNFSAPELLSFMLTYVVIAIVMGIVLKRLFASKKT